MDRLTEGIINGIVDRIPGGVTHRVVCPFIERKDFRDGNGWWIPEEIRVKNEETAET